MNKIRTSKAVDLTEDCYNARKEAFERWERLKAKAPLGTVEEIIEWRNQR